MAASENMLSVELRKSYEFLPPTLSELRVVLLGNSWSERSSVGNFILRQNVFNTEEEPDHCERERTQMKDKEMVLINTPDLLHPDMSEHRLTELIENCVRLSDPGPHVFLLVLQAEGFTEDHKQRLCRVLTRFSDQSFNHSMILISESTEQSSGSTENYLTHSSLQNMIVKCKTKLLMQKNLELQELLRVMGDMVKENHGDHVSFDCFAEARSPPLSFEEGVQDSVRVTEGTAMSGGHVSNSYGLRIVLFGKNDETKTALGNIIIGKKEFHANIFSTEKQCVAVSGEWKKKLLTVVKTPDVFGLSVKTLREEMKRCVSLCPPGPNVLLLLVKPSDFSEEDRKTLKFILSLFGPDAFKHCLVIITHEERENEALRKLIRDCRQRQLRVTVDKKSQSGNEELMQGMEDIMVDNRGGHLSLTEEEDSVIVHKDSKPLLNLVLCGSRADLKASAAEAILGQTELHPVCRPSECVRHRAEVFGRLASVVQLPVLYEKVQEAVIEEFFTCLSLCEPEGVHAFILVLPVAPLTDEDKAELQILHNTFSSGLRDFTIILFTVDSDPTHPAVVNFVKGNKDIQELCKSWGGRSVLLNVKDRQQVSDMLDTVDGIRLSKDKVCSYTVRTFVSSKMVETSKLQAELQQLKTKAVVTGDEDKQSSERLRIVLIGKTGSGKSSSGNTILGRKVFKASLSQTSVTKQCQKAHGEVDGRPVVVVDTPGLFDTSLSNEDVHEEMVKCVSLLAPGPHVFLLVLQVGRLTAEEKETLRLIKQYFGKDSEKFTIILLTGGDNLEDEQLSFEKYLEKQSDVSFKELISDYGGRYHVFNNKDKDNQTQVRELVAKINSMLKENRGSYFTNEMLQEAEAAIKKKMQRILEEKDEEMKRKREELERKHEEEMQEMKRRMEREKEDMEKKIKQKETQLEEMEEKINKESEQRKKEQEQRQEEDRNRKEQEEIQRKDWEQKLEDLEEQIKSQSEETETVKGKLQQNKKRMRKKRDVWENTQREWWEERKKQDEERKQVEQKRLKKLQEEYELEKAKYESQRKEYQTRIEQEEKEKQELQEKCKKEMEDMKKTYEDEARKQAEEMNEFKDKYFKNMEDLMEKYNEELKALRQKYEEKKSDCTLLHELSGHKEQDLRDEMNEMKIKLEQDAKNLKTKQKNACKPS